MISNSSSDSSSNIKVSFILIFLILSKLIRDISPTGLVNVKIVDPAIRATVASLKNKGIPVFVSTGNDSNRKPVAYPACITDTVSVSTFPVGNHDQNTDYFGVLPTGKFNYGSVLFGLIPQTTSSANVAVATQWQKGLIVTDKIVKVTE